MSPIEPLETRLLCERVTAEITRLSEQQNAAMQQAAFIEMTEAEAKNYNARAAQIRELVEQLAMMYPTRIESKTAS